ncbi:putative RNA-binding protein nob1 [Hibiscus syriacus]|uniref:RNA-binding protein nob1 n=1 Tax=Hibiscus syriacus TaxID=106335 RepID=A0A6A3CY73_HIBSY|nr:putative RNA-binding protein nob1 [Hibiscus syriacus]
MRSYVYFLLLFLAHISSFVTCSSFPTNEDTDPCNWFGITCDWETQHVTKINITGSSLKGFLAPEMGQMMYLQELTLHENNLIGTIPKELGFLKSLHVLDLGMNQLTGSIPPDLRNLCILPAELGNLKYLQELRLDRNKLQGTVPAARNSTFTDKMNGMYASRSNFTGLCRSSQLEVVDVSYNYLVGSIPKCLTDLPGASFEEDKDFKQHPNTQCGALQSKSYQALKCKHQPDEDVAKHPKASKPAWILDLERVTGIMAAIIIPWKKSGSEKELLAVYIDSELLKNVTKYSRQELEVACEDVSNIIGSSPDSLVYKGIVRGGPEIAVIALCIKEEQWTSYLELYFQREVADLAKLNHDNVGKLLGYCSDIIYKDAYGEGSQLSWTRRMRIILGIARGLEYLHTELEPLFTISELNSSAVYLTDDFSPRYLLTSYSGLYEHLIFLFMSRVQRMLDRLGFRFDMLLNIYVPSMHQRAKEYLESPDAMSNIVDPELKHFTYDDLKLVCEVIISLCIHPDISKRPSMQEISLMLERGIDTLVLVELKSSSLAWAELALSSFFSEAANHTVRSSTSYTFTLHSLIFVHAVCQKKHLASSNY